MEHQFKPDRRRAVQPAPAKLTTPQVSASPLAAPLQRFLSTPTRAQGQAARPVLRAATLQRQEEARLSGVRDVVQRQVTALGEVQSVQRHAQIPVPARPVTPSDWVTVMRHRAEGMDGQRLDTRTFGEFQALQRQVAQCLGQGFRMDRGEPAARYATYGEHLATLQRHALSAPVARVVLGMVPPAERLPLQRATDEALQRQMAQEQAALNFDTLASLQRQLAELDAETTQPVFQRIQARRGSGNPLPEAIQRHLEQGLNHDLSRVRIHDDAEADKLAKGVNAVAFTTGTDIFFQSGKFNPNTQTGLELLAHEVTHTVQQSQGRVGRGIDPDAGLEAEARTMGAKLAQTPVTPRAKLAPVQPLRATSTSAVTQRLRIQRQYGGPIAPSFQGTPFQEAFLGGHGQAWNDAGTAAKMAVQALPARLKQQFKDMPSQLLGGILTMLRDTVMVLGATTALGAALGAFFGGVGAIPGATIGFELGQVGLTAWGLGLLVHSVASQLKVLTSSVQQFARLSRDAKGNTKTIKAASDALADGLVIFANGVILAIGALMLKQGVKAFATTKLGQRVGAQVAGSPTIKWLDDRQRMTSTNALGRQVLASATGNRPNLAMAGPGQAVPAVGSTPARTTDLMTNRSGRPSGASSNRVRYPVQDLYKGLNINRPPAGWRFRDNIEINSGVKTITTQVTGPNGGTGHFMRSYNVKKQQLILSEAFLDSAPPWILEPGPQLVRGKGIPTVTYVTVYQMKKMGISFGGLKSVKMSTIQNMETIANLEYMRRRGVAMDDAIIDSHSVKYAETTIIQSGSYIVNAKVITSGARKMEIGDLMAFYERRDPSLVPVHNLILQKYSLSRQDEMLIDFDIELSVAPLSEGQVAPSVK